jgi:hypothetical protein
VAVQQSADRTAQGAGAVAVNDPHFAETRKRGFIEKLVNGIHGLVGRLTDDV